MTTPELVAPKFVDLKSHPTINEQWLHNRLSENIGLLGLGDLEVLDSERRQPSGGRLDLLLTDVESRVRYEVEIQLGALDESHIIRTIEYWDIERRRYPQYDHIAVIVAEDITSRFLNVISLFNGAIPLISIQLRGLEVAGKFTLVATRVLDVVQLGTEEEEQGEVTDRAYWGHKASPDSLEILDGLLELVREVQPNANLNYRKHHIGLDIGGRARNFLSLAAQKSNVLTGFKIQSTPDMDTLIDDAGLNRASYDNNFGYYRIRVRRQDLDERRDALVDLIRRARDTMLG